MEKIKKFLSKTFNKLQEIFKEFPITMILIVLTTFAFAVSYDTELIRKDWFSEILVTNIIWCVGTLFSEEIFKNKKLTKIVSIIITFGIAFLFNLLIMEDFFEEYISYQNTANFLGAYISSLLLIVIYKFSKDSKMDIKEYALKIASEVFIISITYAVLNAGVLTVSAIFIALILNSGYEFLIRMFIIMFGIYYIPAIISAFSNAEKIEVSAFFKKLLTYVVFPLTIIAILIIYIYIGKILILHEIPKNVVGRILIALYLEALPVWAMMLATKNEKTNKIASKIPHIYLPLMILEIYSILIRIIEYGFTPIRYLGMLFIVFQIISFFFIIIKKEKHLREIIFVILVFALIYLISPVNYQNISIYSQKKILNEAIENFSNFDNYSEKEKNKFRGAYNYLKYDDEGEKYVESLSDNVKEKLGRSYYSFYDEYSYDKTEYFYQDNPLEELDVSDFSKMYTFTAHHHNSPDLEKIVLQYPKNKMEVNLKEFILTLAKENDKTKDDLEPYFKEPVKVNDTISIYITGINFDYENEDEIKVTDINIYGYILEK